MSRTLHPTASLCRAGVAGAAAVLLLTACGGNGDGSPTGTPEAAGTARTDAAEATPDPGAADFCTRAAGIDERVDSALSDVEGDDPSVTGAFRQIATELRGIDAPDAISSDWEAMAAGLDRMADAFADVDDVTDLDSIELLDRAERDLTAASTDVETYLSDECGL
jgi:hypothetical protein